MKNLNEKERACFKAIYDAVMDCTSGDFGFTDEATIPEGLSQNQFAGYLSQLQQKGYIYIDNPEVNGKIVHGQVTIELWPDWMPDEAQIPSTIPESRLGEIEARRIAETGKKIPDLSRSEEAIRKCSETWERYREGSKARAEGWDQGAENAKLRDAQNAVSEAYEKDTRYRNNDGNCDKLIRPGEPAGLVPWGAGDSFIKRMVTLWKEQEGGSK